MSYLGAATSATFGDDVRNLADNRHRLRILAHRRWIRGGEPDEGGCKEGGDDEAVHLDEVLLLLFVGSGGIPVYSETGDRRSFI